MSQEGTPNGPKEGEEASSRGSPSPSPPIAPKEEAPKFRVADYVSNAENRKVIKQFVIVALIMVLLPVGMFYVVEDFCMALFGWDLRKASLAGLVSAVLSVQGIAGGYALKAYWEEKEHYFRENPHDKVPVWGITEEEEEKRRRLSQNRTDVVPKMPVLNATLKKNE